MQNGIFVDDEQSMMNDSTHARPPRILLSSVFGPYGVDDDFGRKENIMELFHNQVTKGQGLASFRMGHRSAGLYFMAANVNADVTVLDFPSRSRFIREIKKGYDIVGISFIVPNFVKAREMARLCREHAPSSEIHLGGHGAAIEGIGDLIDCDQVVQGEGIRWLRKYLGEDPSTPIVHPMLPASEYHSIYGVPVPGVASNLLVPGVGCVNGCNFCSTSHFFQRTYSPFLGSGKEIFDLCCDIADARGTEIFFVMDENFLKDKARALELIDEMERQHRYFSFYLFSSAETILEMGMENMIRLGVVFVWVGFESAGAQNNYEKNRGVRGDELVGQLRDAGISVLASGILCLEEHTPENISTDIDFMIGLKADLVQFMLYTPLPVTALYRRHKQKGLIKEELPFEEWHGQKLLNWRHPAFPGDSAERWLTHAFKKEHDRNASSIYRIVETAYRGYRSLVEREDRSENLEVRKQQLEARVREYRIMLEVVMANTKSSMERCKARNLQEEITWAIGPLSITARILAYGARVAAWLWKLRVGLLGDRKQPKTLYKRYPAGDRSLQKLLPRMAVRECNAPP